MKKTLAAVLAAAMALSTATVAFAVDHPIDEEDLDLRNWSSDEVITGITYGKDVHRLIKSVGVGDDNFDGYELADWVDKGYATVSVTVTEGSSKLASKPSINLRRVVTDTTQTTKDKEDYTWNVTLQNADGSVRFREGSTVTEFPVFDSTGNETWAGLWSSADAVELVKDNVWRIKKGVNVQWMTKEKDKSYKMDFNDILDWAVDDMNLVTKSNHILENKVSYDNLLRLTFKVADTYGTGATTIGMKLRITIKKSFTDSNGNKRNKGDTYTTDEFKFKAEYYELNQYTHDMQLTLPEVDNRFVKLKASNLYDEIGNDTFTIAFEDVAVFEAKLSAGQKDVNLYYDVDEKTAITDEYPDVDFEFITFRGNPSFVNSGTMTFNAVGGKNTVVYTFDGETLNPLNSTYDSTYDTVTVKGVKKLGTFVIASEVLEVEDEEDNEPVNSAPVVEEPSSSEAPSNDGERNPSTGAC